MFGPEQNGLFLRALNFDAMGFDVGIVFERLMHDAPVECTQRFQLHHVTPTADFFGGVLGLFHKCVAGCRAITAHVHHCLGRVLVLLKKQTVGDVLEVGKRLTLPANQPAGVLRLYVEQEAIFQGVFFNGGRKAEQREKFFQRVFGLRGHGKMELRVEGWVGGADAYFFFFARGVNTGEVAGAAGVVGAAVLVSLVWRMLKRFCTVQ